MKKKKLQRLIDRGESVRGLASELGISYTTARYWLNKYGLQTRYQEDHGSKEGTMTKCSLCGRVYIYTKRAGHHVHECNSCVVNKNRAIKKQQCVDYKGGKCVRCGYNRSLRALCFHHRDPREKKFSINSRAMAMSLESLKEELDKCDLLCANCHMEVHEELEGRWV